MTEINVTSTTQKIIVDPASYSVSVLYTGPVRLTSVPSSEGTPTGSVISTIAKVAPNGYLMLDGTLIISGQALYPDLWAVIPDSWKSENNILLPDARGRTIIGAGTGAGLTDRPLSSLVGEENHVLTGAELAAHAHPHNAHNHGSTGWMSADHSHAGWTGGHSVDHSHSSGGYYFDTTFQLAAAGGDFYAGRDPSQNLSTTGVNTDHAHYITTGGVSANHNHGIGDATTSEQNAGSNAGHNNMQPSLALNWIIKT